ncbi:MAG: hypothetical protein AB8B95_02950 [Pseudohongiellaceae bacterium]
MQNSEPATTTNKKAILAGAAVTAVLTLAALGFTLYSSICPCERTPGGFLFGDYVAEPVADWSFANNVPLCQLQIYAGIRPHSINLNCMATEQGELFLSCSTCTQKYWASKVDSNEPARMRLNGKVYPVVLNRITTPSMMDNAWKARVNKLQSFGSAPYNPTPAPSAPRPDHWWTFQVSSSS